MVYTNINDSDYYFEFLNIKFYFSSMFYRDKFIREYPTFLSNETYKLKNKFRCDVDMYLIILLLFYKKIEKRGFRVYYNNKLLDENYTVISEIR